MKSLKKEILFTILFLTIGIATVTTNIIINGTTPINKNPDDFLVYFSDVMVNGTQDLSLVENKQKLIFTGEFISIGDKKTISYSVTNASKNYDAEVNINCTKSTNYLNITNTFDTTISLTARSTKTGTLTIELKNVVIEETIEEVTCTIEANAVERTTQNNENVPNELERIFNIGDEITILNEKFNVISQTDDTVTMLAKYNIDSTTSKQTATEKKHTFSESTGWEHTPGPKDIDITTHASTLYDSIESYVSYLKELTDSFILSGDLISLNELKGLDCTIINDYSSGSTCKNSKYSTWLLNGEVWWTKSANPNNPTNIWLINTTGGTSLGAHGSSYSVRPVITISKEYFNQGTILFSVDGVVYKAKQGMTWGEWIESEYNIDGYVNTNGMIYQNNHIYAVVSQKGYANLAAFEILQNGEYTLEQLLPIL